ncbi:MAG: hypothetical protein R2822_07585 [Spirosomataceae bacterium]
MLYNSDYQPNKVLPTGRDGIPRGFRWSTAAVGYLVPIRFYAVPPRTGCPIGGF